MIDGETIRDNHQLINNTMDKINTQMEKDHPIMFKEVTAEIKVEFEPKFKQLGVDSVSTMTHGLTMIMILVLYQH